MRDERNPMAPFGGQLILDDAAVAAFELSEYFINGLRLGETAAQWRGLGPIVAVYRAGFISIPTAARLPFHLTPIDLDAELGEPGLNSVGEALPTGVGLIRWLDFAQMAGHAPPDPPAPPRGGLPLPLRHDIIAPYWMEASPRPVPRCEHSPVGLPVPENRVYLWNPDADWHAAHPDAPPELIVITFHELTPIGTACVDTGSPRNSVQLIIAADPTVGGARPNARVQFRFDSAWGCSWAAPFVDFEEGRVSRFGRSGHILTTDDAVTPFELLGTEISGTHENYAYCFGGNLPPEDPQDEFSRPEGVFEFVFSGAADLRLLDDVDADGAPGRGDNCAGVPNAAQADLDRDGIGDLCDEDVDGDLAFDLGDICPTVCTTTDQGVDDDVDEDGIGDACEGVPIDIGGARVNDVDNDGILDLRPGDDADEPIRYFGDNCLLVPNPDQLDSNADGIGDACSGPMARDLDPQAVFVDDIGRRHLRWPQRPWWQPLGGARAPAFVNCADNPDGDRLDENDNCPLRFNPTQLDNDGDGQGDRCDDDDDNDMIRDAADNCPFVVNPDNDDTDSDGRGDACDADDDDDGIDDDDDNCPRTANPGQADLDGDAMGDACDLDDDDDDDNDDDDNCPRTPNAAQSDLDGDGRGDACDDDDDADGVLDVADNCPHAANADQADFDDDAAGDRCDDDDDDDGINDVMDNCPFVPNGGQFDLDEDGAGDACDGDWDGDRVVNGMDNCPRLVNPDQRDLLGADGGADGTGDACQDNADGDAHLDADDNCVEHANDDQADLDADGEGDACDLDDDRDETNDNIDNCPRLPNPDQLDLDGDAEGDACDNDIDGDGVVNVLDNCPRLPNAQQADQDRDGDGDVCDADRDGDGVDDTPDNCPEQDNPNQLDADTDGAGDACDLNDDNDARTDVDDNCPFAVNDDQLDTDADGLGDACDVDDDADGIADEADNCPLTVNPDQADSDADEVGDVCDDTPDGAVADLGPDAAFTPADAAIITRPDGSADAQGDDMSLPLSEPPPTDSPDTGCQTAPRSRANGLWGLTVLLLGLRWRRLLAFAVLFGGAAQAYEPRVDLEPYDGTEVVINPGLLLLDVPDGAVQDFFSYPLQSDRTHFDLTTAFPNGLVLGNERRDQITMMVSGAIGFPAGLSGALYQFIASRSTLADLFARREKSISPWNGLVETYQFHPWSGQGDGVMSITQYEDAGTSALRATWSFIHPAAAIPDERFNDFQVIFTNVGNGDADIEFRYARCDWLAARNGNQVRLPYAVMAININEGPDGVVQQWAHPDSSSEALRRLCLLSNTDTPGVWRYQLRDGRISGCGLPFEGHDPGPGRCNDGNPHPGDGCSPDCRVEPDVDGDGRYEPPLDGMTNVDGTPYDPLRIYDACLFDECVQRDRDGDGVFDDEDNCPDIANPAPLEHGPRLQLDFDNDRFGDVCDDDDDDDGIPDVDDLCPLGFDYLNHFGVPGRFPDYGLVQPNVDGDALADYCDPDDDNDGVLDCGDDGICPFFADGIYNGDFLIQAFPDVFNDGEDGRAVRERDAFDNDADGIVDEHNEGTGGAPPVLWLRRDATEDNCRAVPNPNQANADGDVFGDMCDADADDDGVPNCGEDGWCAYAADLNDNDRDGAVDEANECAAAEAPCLPEFDHIDNDGDGYLDERPGVTGAASALAMTSTEIGPARVGVPVDGADLDDGHDNCPLHQNRAQLDADGDGLGDVCDDDDGDGVFLSEADTFRGDPGPPLDNCPLIANPDQADADDDGLGDACDDDDDDDGVDDAIDLCPGLANPAQVDLDDDGEGDACDADDDGDDVPDDIDNCAREPNSGQADADGDGAGDACEIDDDDDGLNDNADNCPLLANPEQADNDADDAGDACDDDDDNDGVLDEVDNCPHVANPDQANNDSGQENHVTLAGDACDENDDNDALDDAVDNCPLLSTARAEPDLDDDGAGDACDDDDDADGVLDAVDNCPRLPNPDQANNDADDEGDACDDDDDNDGLRDRLDRCPQLARDYTGPQRDADDDGVGDECDDDDDNDRVDDAVDNCPVVANPDQTNSDDDSAGDACDVDDDNDGEPDADDNCPLIPNPDQANADPDEQGDACDNDDDNDNRADDIDNCPLTPNPMQHDADADGVGDVCDDDDDNDGVPDDDDRCPFAPDPDQIDTDGDGQGDVCDDDDDGDGLTDGADRCPLLPNPDNLDSDNDGLGDACDADDDGDSVPDTSDNCPLRANLDQGDYDGDGHGDACTDSDEDGLNDDRDNCPEVPNRDQANDDDDALGDACDPDYSRDQILVDECRGHTPPLLWAKECGGGTEKIGCAAAPGERGGSALWLLVGCAWVRRRRRG